MSSSPRKGAAESENDQKEDNYTTQNLDSWLTLPSSSRQETQTSGSKEVFANKVKLEKVKFSLPGFQHNDLVDLLRASTESDSENSVGRISELCLQDNWISEAELAGPSQAASPPLHGAQIVSESDLSQLSQVRPLKFNDPEQSTIKNYFRVLQKKVQEQEIFEEFMALEYKNLQCEFNCGNEPFNRDRNRYRDILPYDATRVPLGEDKDYINASYIKIVNSGEEYFYIATQGPLPGTTGDFWQMIWENNSNVIVMITREIEGGIIKCHHYWPVTMKKPLELKDCTIFLENSQTLQYFVVRIFRVVRKSTGTSRFVKQLQFTNWPDHGTPAPPVGFIQYVRYVRKSHLTGPIVVHCSAGVGRTGVFICVDVVFCAIENNFSFNIKNIVAQMRAQRYGMIQTKEQYWFCYQIVLEVLQKLVTLD